MSTGESFHVPGSVSEQDMVSTGLQNQPHYTHSSALQDADEEGDVTADLARRATSSIPQPTTHRDHADIATCATPTTPVRYGDGDSMAKGSQQMGAKPMAQVVPIGLASFSVSTLATHVSLSSSTAAETSGAAEKSLSMFQGDEARTPKSTHIFDLEAPPSCRVARNSPNAYESTSEDVDLDPAGAPCIRVNGEKENQNKLMKLIERLVHVESSPATALNMKIINLAEALMQFYKENAQPLEKEGHLSYLIDEDDLQELIEKILDNEEETDNAKCRKIFKAIDLYFGSRGWTAKVKARAAHGDSGISLEFSEQSQACSEPSILSEYGTHAGKRPWDQSSQTITPQKRARIALNKGQESSPLSSSSYDISQSISELPEPQGCSSGKVACPIHECGKMLQDERGVGKHLREVHFPKTIFICPLNKAGTEKEPCHVMIVRKSGFRGTTGHLQSHHEISGKDQQKQIIGRLIEIQINDIYHEVCPYCEEIKPLKSRKDCIDHMVKHATGEYVTDFYDHRCTKDNHDWRNSTCIPQKYRKEVDTTKKKPREPRQDHSLYHSTHSKDDDDDDEGDDDDNTTPWPPGSGNISGGPAQRRNGQGSSSNPPSGPNISYVPGNHGSHNYHISNESFSARIPLPESLGIKSLKKLFKSIRELGRGGFGTVDEVVYRVTNQTYARKIIPFNPRVKHSAEVEILKQLHHLHIVNLAAFYPTSNQLWLLMSPVAEGNLASFLRDDGVSGVNSEIFWEWEGCLASAVRYLHQAGLIHGDIKPQNILVSSDLKVCLADFGSARANHFEEGHENQTKPSLPLTPKYIAPETSYYKVAGYTWSLRTAADIFSLGCVWAEMETISTGISLLAFEDFRSAGSAYTSFQASLPRTYFWIDFLWILQETQPQSPWWRRAPQTLQTVKEMLRYDPGLRPTAEELSMIFQCLCDLPTCTVPDSYLVTEQQFVTSHREAFRRQQFSGQHGFDKEQTDLAMQVKIVPSIQWKLPWAILRCNNEVETFYNGCPDRQTCLYWQVALATSAALACGSQVNTKQSVKVLHQTAKMFLLDGLQFNFEDHRSQFDLCQAKSFLSISPDYNVDRFADSKIIARESLQERSALSSLYSYQYLPSPHIYGLLSLADYFREINPPTSLEDTFKFWRSASYLFDAGAEVSEMRAVTGWHEDISPANVLIMRSETRSPYEWAFEIGDCGMSHFNFKAENSKDVDVEVHEQPDCSRLDSFKIDNIESAQKTHDVWSFGCILAECVAWTVGGSEAIYEADFTIPAFESGFDSASYESYVMDKAQRSKEHLLEIVLDVPESVTKLIAENIVAPMFDPPDQRFSWKGLRVKATSLLDAMWKDYKKGVAKVADPILSLVPSWDKSTLSSSACELHRSLSSTGRSDHMEIFNPHPDHKDVDMDPKISTVPPSCSYALERYIRDGSDYRVLLLASNLAYAGRDASNDLHKIFLQSLMDTLAKFDTDWVGS